MNKDIAYTGFSAQPSDRVCPDGTLAAAINVVPQDGALTPIPAPVSVLQLSDGQSVLYLHKTGDAAEHYILSEADGTVSCDGKTLLTPVGETIVDVSAIGDILVISTNHHLHFLRYKDGTYTYLGTELPRIDMNFALSAQLVGKNHEAKLTFSDTTSGENTWVNYGTAEYDERTSEDKINISSKPEAYTVYAFGINFHQNLLTNVDYRISMTSGAGANSITLYGRRVGGTEYERIVSVAAGVNKTGTTQAFRVSAEYEPPYYIYPSHVSYWNFSFGTILIEKGFGGETSERVIEYTEDNYNAILAAVNKFVNTQGIAQNRFIHPFFIRYALRLSDGTHARVSDPVLMVPNSGYAPIINFKEGDKCLHLYAFTADLQYTFSSAIPDEWRDFIAGVDVFVSAPVYPYEQGESFKEYKNLFSYSLVNDQGVDELTGTSYGYCSLPDVHITKQNNYNAYGRHDLFLAARDVLGFGDTSKTAEWRTVCVSAADDFMGKIAKAGTFYLLHSFEFDEVTSSVLDDNAYDSFVTLPIENDTLSTLTTRQSLTDDMLSNCTFLGARLASYNQRLHLFDYTMRHADPSAPVLLRGYTQDTQPEDEATAVCSRVIVKIRTAKGDRDVERVIDYTTGGWTATDPPVNLPWFFYPHNGAYQATLVYSIPSVSRFMVRTCTLNLHPHPILNGAYWLAGSLDGSIALGEQHTYDPINGTDQGSNGLTTSYYPNSVILSEAASPFHFQSSLMVTLGVERILAMASAVKALSQGQFGQFPLYAFTTEGVWALQTSSTGTYTARQPITRDVILSRDTVTQLDSAVAFATDRGLMLLSGSEAVCFSDSLSSEHPFSVLTLPGGKTLHTLLGHSACNCLPTVAFSLFLAACRMIYDYPHQRIIVYNPAYAYAYVYSLSSRSWGMIQTDVISAVNSYPEALAVTSEGKVVNFSTPVEASVRCLWVTRPIKLDAPDALKSATSLFQRGYFRAGHVATALYGSRDLFAWHLIASSKDHRLRSLHGTPYKFFRLAGVATLQPDESVTGVTLNFDYRDNTTPH